MEFKEFVSINERVDRHRGDNRDWLERHETVCWVAARFGKAGANKVTPFLFDRVTSDRNLILAWEQVERRSGQTAGPDGHTCDTFKGWEYEYLRGLRDALRSGEYFHGPTRTVPIPKKSGIGSRPIRIPNFEDRLVHRAIVQVVGCFLDPLFDERSFGYRPARSRVDALACAEQLVEEGRTTLLLVDLKDAFEHVPQQRLLDVVRQRCGSGPLLRLIQSTIETRCHCGLRRGAASSPLFLNLYADKFIDQVWRKRFPDVPLIRYSDDIAVFCGSTEEAKASLVDLKNQLIPAGLLLKEQKPEEMIVDLANGQDAVWLGYQISRGDEGIVVRVPDTTWASLTRKLKAAVRHGQDRASLNHITLGWIREMGPAWRREDRTIFYERLKQVSQQAGLAGTPRCDRALEIWRSAFERWACIRQRYQPAECWE